MKKKFVKRDEYVAWIDQFREKPVIKVLTGMRRVGKSTILKMYAEKLRREGVLARQI